MYLITQLEVYLNHNFLIQMHLNRLVVMVLVVDQVKQDKIQMELVQELVQVENQMQELHKVILMMGKIPVKMIYGVWVQGEGETEEVVEQEEIEEGEDQILHHHLHQILKVAVVVEQVIQLIEEVVEREEIEVEGQNQHPLQNQIDLIHQDLKVVVVVDKVIQRIQEVVDKHQDQHLLQHQHQLVATHQDLKVVVVVDKVIQRIHEALEQDQHQLLHLHQNLILKGIIKGTELIDLT